MSAILAAWAAMVIKVSVVTSASFAGALGQVAGSLPDCPTEDSVNCVWNAQEQGNGEGQSFINKDGVTFYVTERFFNN